LLALLLIASQERRPSGDIQNWKRVPDFLFFHFFVMLFVFFVALWLSLSLLPAALAAPWGAESHQQAKLCLAIRPRCARRR
jgi:hypothetical protein